MYKVLEDYYYNYGMEGTQIKEPEGTKKLYELLDDLSYKKILDKDTYFEIENLVGCIKSDWGLTSFKQGFKQGFAIAKALEELENNI